MREFPTNTYVIVFCLVQMSSSVNLPKCDNRPGWFKCKSGIYWMMKSLVYYSLR